MFWTRDQNKRSGEQTFWAGDQNVRSCANCLKNVWKTNFS